MKQLRTTWMFIVLLLGALACGATAGCSTEIVPPTAAVTADPTTVAVGAVVKLDGTTSSDPQGLILYYEWSMVERPPGSQATLTGADTAKPYFVADVAGKFTVGLIVSNGALTSEKVTTEITAGPCGTNLPVVESVTANPAAASLGEPVSFTAVVTDADIDAPCQIARVISKEWTLSGVPAGSKATLSDGGIDAPFFVPDVPGDYTVTLVATDELGRSGSNTATVAVTNCTGNAPVIDSVTPSANNPVVGQTVQFASAVSDPDTAAPCNLPESFTYAWWLVGQPAGSTAVLNNAVADAPSLQPDVEGDYTIKLVVTDLAGHESAPVTATITATTCGGAAPTALLEELIPEAAGPSANVVGPDVGVNHVVQLTAQASNDPDNAAPCSLNQVLSYEWSFLALPAGSNAKINDATIVNPSFFTDHPGVYVVGLVVTDSTGKKSGQATFTITADPSIGIGVPGGFTITTVATWPELDGPRGLTKDGAGNIYVVESGGQLMRIAADNTVSTLTKGGFLISPLDVAFEAGSSSLFVTAGTTLARVDLAGVQSLCVDNGAANFRGIDIFNGTGGLRIAAADLWGSRVRFYDPTTCQLMSSNNFSGGLNNPWGVTAKVIGGVDEVFTTDTSNDNVRRNTGGAYANDAGTTVTISNNNILGNMRDVVLTPCATEKVLVANRDGANLVLFANAQNAPPTVISTGYLTPVGLYFEDANNLLVTDETLDSVLRITGPFCNL